ncbi:unnamed protein product [Lupinus luteus]|uniref:PLAC8 motif-containing protein n=1 Tax=Lupinus luteus TaxID=3873 RepID=A0AAV1X272_LUPLU
MISVVNRDFKEEIEESNGSKVQEFDSIDISTSRKTSTRSENPQGKFQENMSSIPNRIKFFNFGFASAKFKRRATAKDQISQLSPSSGSLRECLAKKLNWGSLKKMCMEWIRDPVNMALLAWILCVAVSGAILFLVMTGMLNAVLPNKSRRNAWFEVNNQILNALFTLMCLYHHPKRIYHLVLLCRWNPEDISRLRTVYCKNGTYKPREWTHMLVVVILLNVNCFAQYALCGLNWGYKRSVRPPIGVGVCIAFAFGAPAVAGLYTIISPLGKEYDSDMDEEAQVQISEAQKKEQMRVKSSERRYSFSQRDQQRVVESKPQWSGGILDLWDDISQAYLTLFCTFCVFGWNIERLGFGNMYVHIATFMLFCMAPFWIFILTAVNIEDDTVRLALVGAGIILCFLGLLYGGFWRIQIRKRFNLPAYNFCFGKPAASDCTLWLCCCLCSLAQEVRTRNSYDIIEHEFFRKENESGSDKLQISPLPREDIESNKPVSSSPFGHSNFPCITKPSSPQSSTGYHSPGTQLSTVKEDIPERGEDGIMNPPTPPLINRESL